MADALLSERREPSRMDYFPIKRAGRGGRDIEKNRKYPHPPDRTRNWSFNLVFKIEPLTRHEIEYLKKIIREKCWRPVDCFFDDSYQAGPLIFRSTGLEWQYL